MMAKRRTPPPSASPGAVLRVLRFLLISTLTAADGHHRASAAAAPPPPEAAAFALLPTYKASSSIRRRAAIGAPSLLPASATSTTHDDVSLRSPPSPPSPRRPPPDGRAELFSVAPMMGHTNRHYRYFFRLLSRRSHLYTEMIPSSQIVRAYRRARGLYLHKGTDRRIRYGGDGGIAEALDAEEVLEVMARMRRDPGREHRVQNGERDDNLTLQQLIGTSSTTSTGGGTSEHPVVLQLGGNDPATLGMAAAIGAAYGQRNGEYHDINLNCGCPSNAVGGRSGGCSLMRTPEAVARCVEAMNTGVRSVADAAAVDDDGDGDGSSASSITVKHRLGVRDASTFDGDADRAKNDDEAYEECSSFVRTVSLGGDVTKFHVHARLGLLGEFTDDYDDDNGKQSLWVPGQDGKLPTARSIEKIDHKREQEKAKRRARKATVKNRSVPPLRPEVINRVAEEFAQFEFVSNGGVQTLEDVQSVVDAGLYGSQQTRVVGAMVGRAAINHPCSFAAADGLWEDDDDQRVAANGRGRRRRPTRGQVLQDYIRYCDDEEERIASYGASPAALEKLRRRLVAVPFHLFMGEDGSDIFQRHLKKLREKCRTVKAASILTGATSFVPPEALNKCIDDCVPWEELAKYEGGLKRGSAMQRVVY